MIRSVLSFAASVALVLSLASHASAQTAGGTTDAPAPSATLTPGQTYIRESFTDWSLRCIRGNEALEADTCQLYQLLNDTSGNAVAEFTLLPAPAGSQVAALVTVITPLETVLTEGMILTIDETALPPKPFAWCNRTGCFSRFGVSEAEVATMKRGSVATVSIVALAAPQNRLEITASLRGFTAAFDTLSAEIDAPAE